MSVWAILVAAGRGERLGLEQPKAFARLGEDPLLAEPLRRLEESGWIDAIVLVAPPGWEEPAILLAEELGCGKVSACVPGGETRADSVRAGLAEVPADAVVVLVHDAARPLLPEEVIERVLAPLSEGWDGAVPGLPVADTLKRVGDDGKPSRGAFLHDEFYPDAVDCLRRCKDAGLVVGAVGNMGIGHESLVEPHVDFVSSSERWGVEKPSAEFFARVVEATGRPTGEVAYVGDLVHNDI